MQKRRSLAETAGICNFCSHLAEWLAARVRLVVTWLGGWVFATFLTDTWLRLAYRYISYRYVAWRVASRYISYRYVAGGGLSIHFLSIRGWGWLIDTFLIDTCGLTGGLRLTLS